MSGCLEDVGPPRTPISLRTVIGGKHLREPSVHHIAALPDTLFVPRLRLGDVKG